MLAPEEQLGQLDPAGAAGSEDGRADRFPVALGDQVDDAGYGRCPEGHHIGVRVVRVRLGAHEKAPLHEHILNRVVIYLTDQNTRMTADGKTDVAQHKAGKHGCDRNTPVANFEAYVRAAREGVTA